MNSFAPTAPGAERSARRIRPKLRGLTWLVWRQHRVSFRLWIVFALALTGYLVYLHGRYATYLATQPEGAYSGYLPPDVGFSIAAFLLYIAPLLAAVSFGAQLFGREYTDGTFALVRVQSVSGAAWVRAKLLVSAAMVLLCVTPCAAALTWDYSLDPYRGQIFFGREVFEAIGPAAVALCMVGLFLGAAAGLALRQSGAAQGLSLLLMLALKLGLWTIPGLLKHLTYPAMWSLQSSATGVCVIICAGLAVYCHYVIRHRIC